MLKGIRIDGVKERPDNKKFQETESMVKRCVKSIDRSSRKICQGL